MAAVVLELFLALCGRPHMVKRSMRPQGMNGVGLIQEIKHVPQRHAATNRILVLGPFGAPWNLVAQEQKD